MEPRPAHQLVQAAFGTYRRYPLLFFVLASGVIVPYEVMVLVVTGAGPFTHGSLSFGVSSLLTLIDLVLVDALISALHVHAVKSVLEGGEPRLAPITRQGLRVLPVVAAATIMAWLGILLGCLLIVPGVILFLRWFVVAQAAAIENEGWQPALHRSRQLTEGHYRHLIIFFIYLALITTVPGVLIGNAFGHETTTATSFVVGVLLAVLTSSFTALASALLYFDLRARYVPVAPAGNPAPRDAGDRPAFPRSWDPDSYTDEDRPQGWYVLPDNPERMRFWGRGDPPGWGASIKTPRKIRREWQSAHGAESPERDWGNFG